MTERRTFSGAEWARLSAPVLARLGLDLGAAALAVAAVAGLTVEPAALLAGVRPLAARPEKPDNVQGNYGPGGKPQERAHERIPRKSQAQPQVEHDERQQKQQAVGGDPDIGGGHCAAIIANWRWNPDGQRKGDELYSRTLEYLARVRRQGLFDLQAARALRANPPTPRELSPGAGLPRRAGRVRPPDDGHPRPARPSTTRPSTGRTPWTAPTA